MKQKITLLAILLGISIATVAQVTLSEDFNAPFTLNAATGWTVQNNSTPTGSLNWFQGNNNVFSAFNGSNTNDYFAANYNSTTGTGDISNWLISPTVSLVNGATIQFATRTVSATTVYPDRLEVRVSAIGANTIAFGSAAVSSYSTLVFSVNPLLSNSSASAVPTSSNVSTYPQNWTVYTAVVSGFTTSVVGRIAFRYFVTSGGPNGSNSSYIGLDAVRYTLPCQQPSLTIASTSTGVCGGTSVSLTVSNPGTLSATSYTWNNGSTNTINVISPTVTSNYTVSGTSSSGCVGTATIAVTVTATPNLQIPSYTLCSGSSITLSATGASSFAWNNGTFATTNTLAISPTVTTIYTITGIGSNTLCPVTKQSTITIGTELSVDVSASSTTLCSGKSATLTAISAATSYSWSSGGNTSSIVVTPSINTIYTINATNSTCTGSNIIALTVFQNPTLSLVVSPSSSNVCSNANINVNASGAVAYNYILGPNFVSPVNPINITAPTATANVNSQFTIVGTDASGCSSSSIYSFVVMPNPIFVVSPPNPLVCVSQSISLSASGASTYTWSGASNNSGASVTYSAGATPTNVNYTIVGTGANGCTSTQNINLTISNCVSLNSNENDLIAIYPNPFTNTINLKGLKGSIQIFNLIGERVLNQEVSANEVINTTYLPQGIYLLKLTGSGNETQTLRIIKN